MLLASLSNLYSHHSSKGSGLVKLNCFLFLQHPFWFLSFTQEFLTRMLLLLPIFTIAFLYIPLSGQSLLSFPQNTLPTEVFK